MILLRLSKVIKNLQKFTVFVFFLPLALYSTRRKPKINCLGEGIFLAQSVKELSQKLLGICYSTTTIKNLIGHKARIL